MKLHSKSVNNEERALGIVDIKKSNGMILRNWITYKMREQILQYERKAYYSSKVPSIATFKAKFNQSVASEIKKWMFRYNNEHKLHVFENIVAYKGVLCEKMQEGEYRIKIIF